MSSASTVSGTPEVSSVNCWLPLPVRPPAVPGRTLTAPASIAAPTSSEGAPTARSRNPLLLKSPAASAWLKASPASALPGTPGVSWVSCWLPAPLRPEAEPYRTVTAPASTIVPTSSNSTATARSARPSLLKSPLASRCPKWSSPSVTPVTPGLSSVNCWLPLPVRPPAVPGRTLTAPPFSTAPTSSEGAPTPRSSTPLPLKSPAASASPKASSASALPGTPAVSWVSCWLPVAVSPDAEPYRTVTATASTIVPTSSNSTATARSARLSLLKSPVASRWPRWSSPSVTPATPGVSSVNCWLPVADRPAAEPYRTLTEPPLTAAPTSSEGAPTARSSTPLLLKSPVASASPKPSSVSAAPTIPGVSWVNCWLPVPDRPAAEPYRTVTAPAFTVVPTSSDGVPTARSTKPSLSKSARTLGPVADPVGASLATPRTTGKTAAMTIRTRTIAVRRIIASSSSACPHAGSRSCTCAYRSRKDPHDSAARARGGGIQGHAPNDSLTA